ncbi:MAG: hypothetical protein NTZ32_27225 [Planctomycetales bacterium]|nr:hypothetical protein [Planctomycetales bacterium]
MRITEDLRHQIELVLARVAALEAELARTQATLAQRDARIVELEAQVAELTVELQRRKKGFRPKANAISRPKRDKDGRRESGSIPAWCAAGRAEWWSSRPQKASSASGLCDTHGIRFVRLSEVIRV